MINKQPIQLELDRWIDKQNYTMQLKKMEKTEQFYVE